ncbi:hypothetical protein B296_00005790 [Ensete ventricosum]|uniref:Uncharacterized protein n=1 Tax=Ensete ventricosum TaxID=4639 RepID=A0A427A779_ENSVE|nr:hypothetical protein B296_00005790 [Ensete ventricosum]
MHQSNAGADRTLHEQHSRGFGSKIQTAPTPKRIKKKRTEGPGHSGLISENHPGMTEETPFAGCPCSPEGASGTPSLWRSRSQSASSLGLALFAADASSSSPTAAMPPSSSMFRLRRPILSLRAFRSQSLAANKPPIMAALTKESWRNSGRGLPASGVKNDWRIVVAEDNATCSSITALKRWGLLQKKGKVAAVFCERMNRSGSVVFRCKRMSSGGHYLRGESRERKLE